MFKTLMLPGRVVFSVSKGSARAGFALGRLSARTTYRTGRRVGLGRLVAFAVGVGVGLLLAPVPGPELRDRLRRRWEERRAPVTDVDIAARVRDELAQSPRTWHLPQPQVEVVEGRAILSGEAPHATGRSDLARTAAAVPGVTDVDNRLSTPDQ